MQETYIRVLDNPNCARVFAIVGGEGVRYYVPGRRGSLCASYIYPAPAPSASRQSNPIEA